MALRCVVVGILGSSGCELPKEGVVHESAESSSRPAVVTIGVEGSGFSVEHTLRFITMPKRRGLKTAVGCR
mgnify:CR=1 FL=1